MKQCRCSFNEGVVEKIAHSVFFFVKQMDVRNRQEEISYLRASMTRLRDDLDQQRRLNVCLKERKVRFLKLVCACYKRLPKLCARVN